MSRLFFLCSYDDSFLGKVGDLLSTEAIGFSIGSDSVEYKLGSNPRGEMERMVVCTWDGEAT